MLGKVYERRWPEALASFTANGTKSGKVTVVDTCGFFVKQKVTISATGLDSLYLEIKRIDSETVIFVGPTTNDLDKNDRQQAGQSIDARTDISAFTTALSAQIYSYEQTRPNIGEHYVIRAVYQEEPAVALRVMQVDCYGDPVGGTGGVSSDVNVFKWGGVPTSLGQKPMASSVPVVIASNQSPIPVTLDQDLEAATPQVATKLASAITATTPATANPVLTALADKTFLVIRNTLNKDIGITINSVQWLSLGPNSGITVDLGCNGKKIAAGNVLGVYGDTSTPNQGKLFIAVI